MKNRYLLFIPGLLLFTACNNGKDQPDAYGTFESTEVTVSAEATGKIINLAIEEGQQVKAGVVVGHIDTTDLLLKKQQLADQKIATASKTADLDAQIAVQQQQKANLMVEMKRLEKLLADGAATRKQMDDLNGNILLADKQTDFLNVQKEGIYDQVKVIASQIEQAEEAIRKSRIINPVQGTVTSKFAEPGEIATFGKPLYTIADLDELILRVYLSGTQLPLIRIGQTVEVRFDKDKTTNQKTEGVITWISPTAEFTPKTVQTKEERVNLVYAVKVKVKNDGSLKIGMPGEIKISQKQINK